MKNFTLSFCLLLTAFCLQAQTVADFENLDTGELGYLNGSNLLGGFSNANVFLPNTFTSGEFGDFWGGWAISSVTDTVTSGFANQYSAKAMGGAEGSTNYALATAFSGAVMHLDTRDVVEGLNITNSTYAHNSMRDGDSFAKAFGGETGEDPDFFLLTIEAYLDGALTENSVEFYLADYRSDNSAEDYLLDTWEWVDLSGLGMADSLLFSLTSSDTGDFGMNTPAYFCIDNVTTSMTTDVKEIRSAAAVTIAPNPATDFVQLAWDATDATTVKVTDLIGRVLVQQTVTTAATTLDVSSLAAGVYVVQLEGATWTTAQRLVVSH